ncbi:MAG: glycosyltransferase family 39 protein, partial [Arenicellales bacterium]|nr:glycosyltransferase family 39 protein [Arenicellales bacterium]
VDKPPAALWVQATFAAMLGVHPWVVNLPQTILGLITLLVLYWTLQPAFGHVAAGIGTLCLAIIPASVLVDSRNEPDTFVILALTLALLCLVRSVRQKRDRWMLVSAALVGLAFTGKMWVAFIPVPAFLTYYLVSSRSSIGLRIVRPVTYLSVILLVSSIWVLSVAMVPAGGRPYVGSTPDNSIWTLLVRHNGLDRFGRFGLPGGPLGGQPQSSRPPDLVQAAETLGINVETLAEALGPPPPNFESAAATLGVTVETLQAAFPPPRQVRPPPPQQGGDAPVANSGILRLFEYPLAGHLGWLVPLSIIGVFVSVLEVFPVQAFRKTEKLRLAAYKSPVVGETLLWAGWLLTAAVVFGSAQATLSHPYYLAALSVPLSAIVGIGMSHLWTRFSSKSPGALALPIVLIGTVGYQAWDGRTHTENWLATLLLLTTGITTVIMLTAIWTDNTKTKLATGAATISALALTGIPVVYGTSLGEHLVFQPSMPNNDSRPARVQNLGARADIVSAFMSRQGDAGTRFDVATVGAHDAAEFIIDGIPALAIGGFRGNDPVFDVSSFRDMASRGELHYFLAPPSTDTAIGGGAFGPPPGGQPPFDNEPQQSLILDHVRAEWLDVSRTANLPPGTLFRYLNTKQT